MSFEKLKKDNDRYKDLYAGKAASEVSYDDARFQFENAKVKVDQIRQQLRDAQVIAPVSGTVVAKNIEVGEFVPRQHRSGRSGGCCPFESLAVFVGEHDAYRVEQGQAVTITTDIYPGETFTGKVTFVSPRGDASHNYEVEVAVDNSKAHPLKSGTFITAAFSGNAEKVEAPADVEDRARRRVEERLRLHGERHRQHDARLLAEAYPRSRSG